MIKKFILLKNNIEESSEKEFSDLSFKDIDEVGLFPSEIIEGLSLQPILVNALAEMIKEILPDILISYYPDKTKNEILNFINNNVINILYTKINSIDSLKSILDHYILMSMDSYPLEEDIETDEEFIGSITEKSILFSNIDSSILPSANTLEDTSEEYFEDTFFPKYSEEISKEILINLLYEYVDVIEPLGPIDAGLGKSVGDSSSSNILEEINLEHTNNEIEKILQMIKERGK